MHFIIELVHYKKAGRSMALNLLTVAKRHQKERKWNKAVDYFEQYMNKSNDTPDDSVYISYANCLRVVGNTNRAEEVLQKGRRVHSKGDRILLEFHNLYDALGDWDAAKSIAETLIERDPLQANYHFRLGRTYSFLNNYKEAEKVYKTGLQHQHKIPFDQLIEKVQRGFTNQPADVSSKYVFINGRNNLGAIIHQDGSKKYFTKISRMSRGARREETFYREICAKFPTLKETVPSYIDSKVIDHIIYLTIEMIDDDFPIEKDHINNIITSSLQIASITYQDLINEYSNPNYLFQLTNRAISVVLFFTNIHEKHYNERLFTSLYQLIERNDFPIDVKKTIQQLESLIMKTNLYAFIKPEKHYSLLQGDFIPQNIKINRQDEVPIVFDWGTFTIGPHFIDIARYLSASFIPYSEVKKVYLSNNETGGQLSVIEQIFFLYSMILFYLLTTSPIKINTRLSDFILPALKDMELLILEFKKNEYDQAVETLINKKSEKRRTIQEMNQKLQKLEKDHKHLHEKFTNLLESKSWKITAPLRKIVLWRKNR